MKVVDLLFGELASLLSNAIVFIIVALMFVISLRLFLDRRKKGYMSMTISLIIVGFHYLLKIYFSLTSVDTSLTAYALLMLKMISFVLLNLGIYQLYNRTFRKQYIFFYGLIIMGFVVSVLHFSVPQMYNGTAQQVRLLQDIGSELYVFVLIFLCFYMIPPFIGQQMKYQSALTVYFFMQSDHLVNVYMYGNAQPILTVAGNVLPILFYFLLFMLLFDRVVELMQAIYNSSITDGLTRLFNRKFFYTRVTQHVQRHLPVYILFSDIDNFKKLNDTQGHQMGDDVLKQVAQIMKEEAEDCGIAGRYGGEEMVVMVTDPSVKMDAFAERVRSRIEKETIVTASIGYSKYKNGLSAEELIKQADEAMYKAKTSGKNKVVKYS
ncbi:MULTISPECIES: GGDEF domain-containing protein [Paenibacillus]|uniref:Diguanylate cyclase n=2 Tax=Paenibacillus TaxID=44249 RepID=A0A1V4HJT9_9BACL|nr:MULTISPECIES: GGDEF domain-containing protein [Paenibacillus]MEC0229228.1 GGDEF domain-containing protein [Paenibacillus alba]NQX66289.1 GGDEF domain-containing protein [Paenibacillus alba]OPH57171.1 diguanylate cyclase [Paenibacillus ferrarius]